MDTPAEVTSQGGNGQKVTNAEIRKDIQYLTQRLDEYIKEARDERKATEERVRCVELEQQTIKAEIKTLKEQAKFWLSAEGLAAAFGIVLGFFGIGQK